MEKTTKKTTAKEEKDDAGKKMREKLLSQKKNGASKMSEAELCKADEFCEGYKQFIGRAKTEREAVKAAVELAQAAGFKPYEAGKNYKAGEKLYKINRNKAVMFAIIGKKPAAQGVLIAASHIDSPRLDLKQNPLYEADDLAFLKTHYYGGIKKYQWTATPLSLHGVVCLKDGSEVEIRIGEEEGDPLLCVTDLLIHLSAEQMQRKTMDAIKGENLNLLVGSRPLPDDEGSDSVKLNIMRLLNEKYGIIEDDFLSAELEAVPAFMPRDVGLDRSMIGAYGHDDRVCAYPALMALIESKRPEYTSVVCLADKEETGSDGNTGLNSSYLVNFISDIAESQGACPRAVLSASRCLSADVSAAYDPNFGDVYEKRNSAFINCGIAMSKYTGSRGKYDTSDASAEYIAKIRGIFDAEKVLWQSCELGKIDAGGGGTVAKYIAQHDVDVVDVGVPVLSMHAPFEVVSKLDVYMTKQAMLAFFKKG